MNRLAAATSPYLLQHANNPVDWYEWSDEAFDEAKRRNVPVLLSVGYSSCHWCHVMAHESFEDPDTAAMMNDLFVNIKVDREERPDVDAVYMQAVQALTGRGGWPMTVFLTPDRRPFHAGTYFPATDRAGLPSFRRVLAAVAEAWAERQDEIESHADRLVEVVTVNPPASDSGPDDRLFRSTFDALTAAFDPNHGGFGGAPKFPQESTLEFLLRVRGEPWAADAGPMLVTTLHRMADGGIFDQVGGGFARYSVDARWRIPHFEKMLYTNAQLGRLYLWSGLVFADDDLTTTARRTFEYLLRDLRLPVGGFASAEDADSEGREGTFYVFTAEEFRGIVGPDLAPIAEARFGVTDAGNFEGANHLFVASSIGELAAAFQMTEPDVAAGVEAARERLFQARSARVRPGLDDKVLTEWNGLAIRALAEAGAVLAEPTYLDAAEAAARFVLDHLRTENGRLLRSWAAGRASIPGFAGDYAALAVALFTLYATTGNTGWYREAVDLVEALLDLFADPSAGFATTGRDVEAPLHRRRDHYDSPSPSANSLAAEALLLAFRYTGDGRFDEALQSVLRAGTDFAASSAMAAPYLLAVAFTAAREDLEIAIVGPDASDLVGEVWRRFLPGAAVAVDTDGTGADDVPLLEDRFVTGMTAAYVCHGFVCERPVTTSGELGRLLDGEDL